MSAPRDRETILAELRTFMDTIPFNQLLGMQVDELGDGYAKMSLPFRDALIGDMRRPALHGGVTSALMDTCGGAAVFTKGQAGDRTSTLDLRIDYLRPGKPEPLIVEATVIRLGNRAGVTDMIAYQGSDKATPVAMGRAVYNIRRASD